MTRAGPRGPKAVPTPPGCPDCAGSMVFKPNGPFGPYYRCLTSRCPGAVASEPDGKVKGVPAPKATRDARIRAHAAFDPLWRGETAPMSRGEAYRWLARVLGFPARVCHIGHMDEASCARVLDAVQGFPGNKY